AATAQQDAASLLRAARTAVGFDATDHRIFHYHAATSTSQDYQSDRSYPPYFLAAADQEIWFGPATGVQRAETRAIFPGAGPGANPLVTLDDGRNAVAIRGDRQLPLSRHLADTNRCLMPWAVLAAWSAASGVSLAGTENYRDSPRTVLK